MNKKRKNPVCPGGKVPFPKRIKRLFSKRVVEEEDEKARLKPLDETESSLLSEVPFSQLHLRKEVMDGISAAGFTHCTVIQERCLPFSLAGKDVAGQAQTGTGKTAAFLITVFQKLLEDNSPAKKSGSPRCLILAPTRELTQQIFQDSLVLGRYTGLEIVHIVGGIDYKKQRNRLLKGCDIVIATPGRLIDYLKQGVFKPQRISVLIVDEADRMFDMGFVKDLRFILRKLPSFEHRQSLLFSATLSLRVMELTYEFMNLPVEISITPGKLTVEKVKQELYHVGNKEKFSLLLGILNRENWRRVIIFANTKREVERLGTRLKRNGFDVQILTGNTNQQARFRIMKRFKTGKIKMIVATDVASRGIHVDRVTHVINYDLPQSPENYVHRIGRTARAGQSGKAITLACERYVQYLETLEEFLSYKLPVVWPEDHWFVTEKYRTRPASPARGKKVSSGRQQYQKEKKVSGPGKKIRSKKKTGKRYKKSNT